jgi:hypothetical protein
MLALFIGSARMQELEDACNALFKIKQSKEPKLFGWYYHEMICYCLENDIIKSDNIKYVIKSSLSPSNDYYNKFIDYKTFENFIILAIHSMIGNFEPNLN